MADLSSSERVQATGLSHVLADMIQFSFAGEPCVPPPPTVQLLEQLFSPAHALSYLTVKKIAVMHI
jgi:hypothetical protein